jgi:small subunit ribosomal protein S9
MADEPTHEEPIEGQSSPEEQAQEQTPAAQTPAAEETTVEEPRAEETPLAEPPAAEELAVEEAIAEEVITEIVAEELAAEAAIAEEAAVEEIAAEEAVAEEAVAEEAVAEEIVAEVEEAAVEEAVAEEIAAEVEETLAEEIAAEVEEAVVEEAVIEELIAEEAEPEEEDFEEEEEPAPRVKPAVPGAHLEVDIVPEGVDPLARESPEDPYAIEDEETEAGAAQEEAEEEKLPQPISTAAIDLAAGARYQATGKRKTAIARVILRPGSGAYLINGRTLEEHFPRATLLRNIRQPLETVGYEERMDVVARLHGGGISAQAGALRHGISRALLEADPNLRGELKRRGFLTRDSRAKERKKAGLKKARKRPQFSKR